MIKKYRDIVKDPILAVQWTGNNQEDILQLAGSSFYMKGKIPVIIEKISDVEIMVGDYVVKFPGEDQVVVGKKEQFEELFEEIKE